MSYNSPELNSPEFGSPKFTSPTFTSPKFLRPRVSSFSNESICTMSMSDEAERTQHGAELSFRPRFVNISRRDSAGSSGWHREASIVEYPSLLHFGHDSHLLDQPVISSPNHNPDDEPDPLTPAPLRTLNISNLSMTDFVKNNTLDDWRYLPLKFWAQNDGDPLFRLSRLRRHPNDVRGLLSNRHDDPSQNCQLGLKAILPQLLVIDCVLKKVVPFELDREFVALSYVWGPGRGAGQESFQTDLKNLRLPRTVQDAINVVLVLGMRYLWVDRHCINKSDPGTYHHMISNMDTIYRAAPLTIIAAAGSDDESGLSSVSGFVGGQAGCEGTVPPWNGIVQLEFSDSTREEWENSVVSTRAWTYQEGLLSRRHLIFRETGVTLRCNIDCVSESEGIFAHINEYSRRSLTFPSDSLRAFLGVLKAYERLKPPVMHVWGVPLLLDPTGHIQNPGQGLLWKGNPTCSLSRIQGLPSWSWAGWRGWCAPDIPEWYVTSRSLSLGPYRWLKGHLRHEATAWEPNDVTLEILTGSQLTDISEYFRAGHNSPSGEIGGPPAVLYVTAWSTSVNARVSKKSCVQFSDEDLNGPAATMDPAPESLCGAESKVREDGTCEWTAAVIFWGAPNAIIASTTGFWTQSLLLENIGEDTFRRVGVLETDWHKSDLDEQGRITLPGRTLSRTRLRIV